METNTWQWAWREGFQPLLTDHQLQALAHALETDDPRLQQGVITVPSYADWPVNAACALSYCGWQGDGLETVAEVQEFFARTCFEADQQLGSPAACRRFLNWFDNWPRKEVFPLLLKEIRQELTRRREKGAGPMSVELTTVSGQAAVEIPAADGEIFVYLWTILNPPPGQGGWGVWLTKLDQGEPVESYRVSLWPNGGHWCGCPDWKYRGFRKRDETCCKHVRCARELQKVLRAIGVTA